MDWGQFAFWILSGGAVLFALLCITRKSAVVSALMLIMTFVCLAGVYLTLSAQFLAVVQVAVYAGAIMVLVLFVIMLLNLHNEELQLTNNWKSMVGILAAVGVLAQILAVIYSNQELPQTIHSQAGVLGTTESVGMLLYTSYSFVFEMASIILIAAAVGAIILAKKRIA
jgi:NADH-quinone oxidoreductase subunit J